MGLVSTIVIVDDNAAFRRQARALLEAGGFVVVGEAGTVSEAIRVIESLRPQVALVDVGLPDGDGFAVADAVRDGLGDDVRVILTSSRDISTYAVRMASSPASAFVAKDEISAPALVDAVGALRPRGRSAG